MTEVEIRTPFTGDVHADLAGYGRAKHVEFTMGPVQVHFALDRAEMDTEAVIEHLVRLRREIGLVVAGLQVHEAERRRVRRMYDGAGD